MDKLNDLISQIHPSVLNIIQDDIARDLDKCGLFYRIFSRRKTTPSISEKLSVKSYSKDKKMQDIIGTRIVLYFNDDINICEQLVSRHFHVVDISKDDKDDELFKPTRLNYVCRLPEETLTMFPQELWDNYYIDKTIEIQLRTIFSEGWHEVEHDLRYKCQQDWTEDSDLSRNLNGLLATLETCDWSIINIFDQLAYRKYKEKNWESMLRHKLRMRLTSSCLNDAIKKIFDNNNEIPKLILRLEREPFMIFLADRDTIHIPKSMDNIAYCINLLYLNNRDICDLTPPKLKEQIASYKERTLRTCIPVSE